MRHFQIREAIALRSADIVEERIIPRLEKDEKLIAQTLRNILRTIRSVPTAGNGNVHYWLDRTQDQQRTYQAAANEIEKLRTIIYNRN